MRVIAGDITRPNLQLEVFYGRNADEKLGHLLAFCKSEATEHPSGSGIVYAGTRARCEELAALLQDAAFLVTNDSGPMHLAVAAGTPVVALFGPTDPARIGPYGPGR